ncbi:MAG: BatD family protein [Candidatus Methanofastidiosia archaeon]|jgi:uncharacterized repeat protein (TIGR01451 family)
MRKLVVMGVLVVLPLVLMITQAYSQQESTVPPYLAYDDRTLILKEYLRQDQIELVPSFRTTPNEWHADVYLANPPTYFQLAPVGSVMQNPSDTFAGEHITVGPDDMYLIVLYDFEHDLIIEAGEWKDLNGDFIAQDNEWFDENGNGAREYGEWTDTNANGIIDIGELSDNNGNGVFDIGEWHEGKNTDGDPTNNLAGEFNGAVDPPEWIGMNLDRSITKKVALKIYKWCGEYREIDYEEFISPNFPAKIFQHPALRAMTTLTDNQKLVLLLSLEDCERCEIVGDVAWYEDEFARIVINFQGFFRETLHTTLPRCEGCYEAEISYFAKLQVYIHEKYTLLDDGFYLHSMEPRGLPDNKNETTGYYYTPIDEMTRIDEYNRRIRSLESFDPYYLVVRDDNELVLFETIYGAAIMVPYNDKEEKYSSHVYTREYPDGTEKDIRIEVAHVYQIETLDCEQVLVARLLIDENTDENVYNTPSIDPDEKIFTVFYYACNDHFENNVIFPQEYSVGPTLDDYSEDLSDFAIIVEKIELETEKVWLKFIREVDSEIIPTPALFPYGERNYQIVFDELDRDKPLGDCDFYPKDERNIPRFKKILVDVCLPIKDLLNNVVLKYEDLKGNPTETASYEEQPWEMAEWNTEVEILQARKVAYNPNAADYTGLGYEGNPPFSAYVGPLDPAPGLVSIGPNLIPNFQISDEDFSGTCVPGDTITFYIEVFNGTGAPLSVRVEDDIPQGMTYVPLSVSPPGIAVDTDVPPDGIADLVVWNIPSLPPGYTLLSYQADVVADGSVNFGGTITNSGATVYYYESGIQRTANAPTVNIEVQAAQLIKEVFQDAACTIPAPTILPGSRLYYRLTVYNTISPASPIPFSPVITDITDTIPPPTTNPQYVASPPGLAPQPIVGNTISWQGATPPLAPGASTSGIYSVFVPVGSAGRISNDATLTYLVAFPPLQTTQVTTTSNLINTWIITPLDQITEPLEPCVTMSIYKEGPRSMAGGVITYTIIVTNSGSGPYADAFNIVIKDKIPQYTTLNPASISSTNLNVTWNIYDSDGDTIDDLIVFKLNQLAAGSSFELEFDVTVEREDVPYNCYLMRVFTYDKYKQIEDRYLGMGGIARGDQYKITPEDMVEVITDSVFTQVMKGAERLENYLIKIFESRIYNEKFYFDFIDFNEKERSARFRLFNRVESRIDMNIYWGILEQVAMETGSPQIYAEDTFLAHILLTNNGEGTAYDISYEIDAPDLSPVDMTWVYDVEKHLQLEIAPGEEAGLLFLMKAPSVSHETTFPVKIRIIYSDGLETYTETKTAYLNVLSQRRARINLQKNILEGKSVVKETGKEVADMRVGEERTIVAYIKNTSEDPIKQIHYIDQIPQGLEVIEGDAEWMGSLEPGEVVKVTYKIKVKQIGVYQFRGKTFYKDERDHVYEGVSNVTEIRVVTDPGPKLRREIDSSLVSKGDTLTVVIRVENDTPNPLDHIQVVDIIPEGFTIEKLETRGLKEDKGTIRYYIEKLKPEKYILLKYTLKAGEKAGKFEYKGVRLAYENGDGIKEEIIAEDHELMIPETETPNIGMTNDLKRKVDADGEYITVLLTLSNTGGISATDIKINTALLEGTSFVEASSDYLIEGDEIVFSVDEIAAGEQYTVKYTIKVPHFNQDRSYSLMFNTAYSDEFDREYSASQGDQFEVKSQKPSVKIVKVVEKNEIKLNFSVRVAINVVNEGEIPAITTVTDPLPEGMVLLSGSNQWEGRLEPGESAQMMYEMLCTKVGSFSLPQASAIYQDRWKIAYTAESGPANLNIRGISLEKGLDVDTLKVGEVAVVTISVTNTYDERATNVVIEDLFPEGLELVEGQTNWKIEVLEPGETKTFTYSLKPVKEGTFNLGAATATFIDVYNDKHTSSSEPESIAVDPRIPPSPTPTGPPPTPSETPGKGILEPIAGAFDLTLILMIFLVMAITMMLAFLLVERRRTEEEYVEEEMLPPLPEKREVIWKREEKEEKEEGKEALPTARERAEEMEETKPLEIISKRREKTEERKGKVEELARARDIRDLFGKEAEVGEAEEVEEFIFEEREEKGITKEDLDLEDLFAEEKEESRESEFTSVQDILTKPKEEEPEEKSFPWKEESESNKSYESSENESTDLPDIRELIKGTKKSEKPPESKEIPEPKNESENSIKELNPRDVLKKKDED